MPVQVLTEGSPAELGYQVPAEWEPHAATWLAWPASVADWPGKGGAIPWVFAEIIRHLQESERIRLLVPDADERRQARALLSKAHVDLKQVDFVEAATNRTWARDFMPIFLTRPGAPSEGATDPEVAAVKWVFNGWARYPNHRKDDRAGLKAAQFLELPTWRPEAQIEEEVRRLVLEGGGIEVDGEGTLIVTTECLLTGTYARNRELGRVGTEKALKAFLGVRKVIWVESGIVGDDTSGHTDDFVRFVAPGRILLCDEPNQQDPNHQALSVVRKQLERAQDSAGRSLEIIKLPMPQPLWYGKDRLPASYANYYVGNRVVLVPTFNDPADRIALGILQDHFPGRQVVGIHALDLVLGLGTLHCSTMQEPRGTPGTREARPKTKNPNFLRR